MYLLSSYLAEFERLLNIHVDQYIRLRSQLSRPPPSEDEVRIVPNLTQRRNDLSTHQ